MSQQSSALREGYFDWVRKIVVRVVVRHWNLVHEPLGIGRGTDIAIQFIADMKRFGDPLTGEKWPYAEIPEILTVRRRFNEAASITFYEGKDSPLECVGRHEYMGKLESQYRPRGVACDAIPEEHGLYQEWKGNRIVCYKHAQGKMVRHIAGKLTGFEKCFYCQQQPEIMPA